MPQTSKERISIDNLKFDKNNPRLPQKLIGNEKETDVIDYMLRSGNILELMKSIAETGYSDAEPLLVVLDAVDNKYIVVEGNRRLTAIKLLRNPELARVRKESVREIVTEAKVIPEDVPVIVYDKREDILDYLGYRHITGVKDWGPLEKARYLEQLYIVHEGEQNKGTIYSKLAKMIGSKANYVYKLHQALKLYDKANDEAYYGAKISEEQISFSLITTALGYNEIVEFLGLNESQNDILDNLNEDNYKKLFLWLFDKESQKVFDSRQISALAEIVAKPIALAKLESGSSIEEAVLYTEAPSKAFMGMLDNAKKSLRQASEAIAQLSEEPVGAKELLEENEKIIKMIRGGLDNNFAKKDSSDLLSQISQEQLLELLKRLDEQKK